MTLTLEESTFFRKSFAWSDDHDFTHGCVSKRPSKESSEIELVIRVFITYNISTTILCNVCTNSADSAAKCEA